MKRILFIIMVAALGLSLFSCKKKYVPVELEDFNTDRNISLYDTTSYPSSKLTWVLKIPSQSQKQDASYINEVIIQAVCDTVCDCFTIEDAINFYTQNYQQSFRSDNTYRGTVDEDIAERLLELLDASFENFEMEPTYNKDGFFCFTLTKNNYSGGAHGMWDVKGYVIDNEFKGLIGFHDIIENIDTVQSLLIEALLKKYNVEKYDDLSEYGFFGFPEFSLTENITLTEDGVMWIFNPYEIASFATGVVEVTVPYDQLAAFTGKTNPISRLIK